MSFVTFSALVLGLACGFGAMIYTLVALWHLRYDTKKIGVGYGILAVAYVVCTIIIAGRQLGFFLELPRGTSLLLLAPILGIPPGIQWAAWLKARRLVREAHEANVELHG